MNIMQSIRGVLGMTMMSLAAFDANAQEAYPSRPIRVISPSAPGSPVEFLVRVLGEKFQQRTGQALVLDSRAGASGIIAAEAVAKSAPDGYTLLCANVGQLSINPHTFKQLPYDPDRSFAPITRLITAQYVFAAHPGVPAANLRDFVAWAKANPGKASFASSQAGAPGHFAGVMLSRATGIDLLHVPYKGAMPAITDLLAGRVSTMFSAVPPAAEFLRSGKLKAFAVTSERRIAALPEVASFTELGFADVVAVIWGGMLAPAGTPAAMIGRLNTEFTQILNMPDVVEKLRGTDQEPAGNTAAQFAEFMTADRARWGAAVKASGFQMSN